MISGFHRRFVITIIAALVLGAALSLWILFQPQGGSWATVYTGARLNVRETCAILKARELTVVSESELWVLLDDFSELRQIPLDLYDEYVEPFDPRNDGYAAELRSFFSREGERRFFVKADGMPPAALERLVDEAVRAGGGSIRRLEYAGGGLRPGLSLLLFAAAFAVSAALLGKRHFFPLLCLLPVLAFLSFFGPAGIAAAGFLLAVYCLSGAAIEERFRSGQGVSRVLYRSLTAELRGWFRTFPLELVGALAGIILYWISSVLGSIPLYVSVPAFCFFIPLLLLPRWATAGRINNTFFPISIRKEKPFLLFPPVLPVFAVAFAIAFGIFVLRGAYETGLEEGGAPRVESARSESVQSEQLEFGRASSGGIAWPAPPSPERYYRHASFQQGFSRRSLHDPAGAAVEPYGTYNLGSDGLLSGFTELPNEKTFPPYPETLLELGREPKGGNLNLGQKSLSLRAGFIILALMLGLSVPAVVGMARYRKKRRGVL